MTLASVLDRNGIQGAEKRGLATAENPVNEPREGGAHWLVLSAAALAFGGRVEDSQALKQRLRRAADAV